MKNLKEKSDHGDYGVHELVNGMATEDKWSVALIEIQDSPKHFHRIEKELFVVVNGALEVEVDGTAQILQVGEDTQRILNYGLIVTISCHLLRCKSLST